MIAALFLELVLAMLAFAWSSRCAARSTEALAASFEEADRRHARRTAELLRRMD